MVETPNSAFFQYPDARFNSSLDFVLFNYGICEFCRLEEGRILYGIHLILNIIWAPIFCGLRQILWSFYEIIVMTIFAAATSVAFYRIDVFAGLIMIPYVVYLLYGIVVTYCIYKLNGKTHISHSTQNSVSSMD